MKTTLGQLCTGYYDTAGMLKFQIVTSVDYVNPGDLPFASIFVHQIGTPDDPKSDKFLRVGNPVDLTTMPLSRDAALIANIRTYLTTDFTTTFPDVTTATAAKLLIQTRVDQLIADWIKFNAAFIVPASIELPASDSTIVKASTAAYVAAKKAAADAATALTTARDAYTDAQAAATRAASDATTSSAACALATQNRDLLATGLDATAALRLLINSGGGTLAAMNTEQTAHPAAPFDAAVTSFQGAVLTEAQQGAAVVAAAQTAIGQQRDTICNAAGIAATTKATADAAVATALTAQTVADAAATAAQSSLETALATLLQVCPSYQV
jgi:hypothetical protein